MPARRGRGEGGLHWDERRQRWIATADLGFTPAGKRIRKSGSGRTKTEARQKLKEVLRDRDDGLAIAPAGYTVADAVRGLARLRDGRSRRRDDQEGRKPVPEPRRTGTGGPATT